MLEIVNHNDAVYSVYRNGNLICDLYKPDNAWVVSEVYSYEMFINFTSDELRQLADKLDELNCP